MKKIKVLAILFVVLLGSSMLLQAQSQERLSDDKKKEMKKQMEANEARLNLNEDQKEPYRTINRKYGKMAREVRDEEIEREEKMEKLKKIRNDRNLEMKALLSDDQYVIYLEIEAERKELMKQKSGKKRS